MRHDYISDPLAGCSPLGRVRPHYFTDLLHKVRSQAVEPKQRRELFMPPTSRKANMSRKLADLFDLPRDVILDLPKICALGNTQISIENHRGIIEYTTRLIRVNTSRGELKLAGSGLVIQTILRDEIVVEGRILSIEYVDWGLA